MVRARLFFTGLTGLIIWAAPAPSGAEEKVIIEKCHYVWGDNDSRLDARQMCFLQAKKRVAEKIGSFVATNLTIQNGKLAKEELRAFSSAIFSLEIENEFHGMANNRNYTSLTVKARFDPAEAAAQLSAIASDQNAQKQLVAKQAKLDHLEKQLEQLRAQLAQSGRESATPLRKDRNVKFAKLEDLYTKKEVVLSAIRTTSAKAYNLVERGMTAREVRELLGPPRATMEYHLIGLYASNYGEVWVVFSNLVVACLQKVWQLDVSNNCVTRINFDPRTVVK